MKDVLITITDIQEFPDHVVRTFHVTRTGQAIERIVKQFHFIAWPDFGVPSDPASLLGFIRKVNTWRGIAVGGPAVSLISLVNKANRSKYMFMRSLTYSLPFVFINDMTTAHCC